MSAARFLVLFLALTGCAFGTRGELHAVPSTGADLPFASGVYVQADAVYPCPDAAPGVTLDATRARTRWRVVEFRDDGTFTWTDSIADLTGPLRVERGLSLDVRGSRGTYRVVGDVVEGRVVVDGGDSGARWVVIQTDMRPTGADQFAVDRSQTWWQGGGVVEICARTIYRRVSSPVGATPSVTVTE